MAGGLARLKRRADFLRVAGTRIKAVTPGLVLQAAPPGAGTAVAIRVGFTATRKIGNAVVRNRMKRRLRALGHALLPAHGLAGSDHVLIGRTAGVERDYAVLGSELGAALARARR